AEQKQLAYRAAELYEQTLKQPDKAIATWRQVLSLDENDRGALEALARLYPLRNGWGDLAWVQSRQIELQPDQAARRPLRFAMARVFEQEIGDAFEAIASYKAVLEATADDREALAALERLYEKEGLWADLLDTLDAQARLKQGGPSAELAEAR